MRCVPTINALTHANKTTHVAIVPSVRQSIMKCNAAVQLVPLVILSPAVSRTTSGAHHPQTHSRRHHVEPARHAKGAFAFNRVLRNLIVSAVRSALRMDAACKHVLAQEIVIMDLTVLAASVPLVA